MNKKLFLLLFSASCMAFSACGNNSTNEEELTVKNYTDSVVSKIENVECESKISVDFPEKGNEALVNSVREWILDATLCSPTTNMNNANEVMKDYVRGSMKFMEPAAKDIAEVGSAAGCAYDINIKKAYEDSKVVTFTMERYIYLGGAHGIGDVNGMTFRKSDGKILGYNMLNLANREEIAEVVEKNLMQYFDATTKEELQQRTFMPEFASTLPLPQTPPYLTKDTMVFVYQSYEIAPYAAGNPEARVPLSELENYLSASFKKTK